MNLSFSRSRRGAFTLIELLVVISIIAMLATLLFPVGSKVIGQVHDAKCRNNMRQLGMLIITAATDNDGTYPAIENDPKNPIHTPEDGKVWTMPELVQARGGTLEILKCPADLRAKLFHPKESAATQSYFDAKGSSYEWYPLYEGENINLPRRYGFGNARTLPPSRVRLLMDYAENGEAPHDRSPEASSMHVFYGDGSVRPVAIIKEQ